MQNDRTIASGDIIFDITSIIITDRLTDTSIITAIIIHTGTVFGCFGEATKGFKIKA